MAGSFAEILERYRKQNIQALSSLAVNRRNSANQFARLAEKGSIGAALTFGLLSAESDEAEDAQKRTETLVALAKSEADIKRSEAEIARLNANTNVVVKTGVATAKANIEATKSGSSVAQQRADSEDRRQETDDFYKRESIKIQAQRNQVIEAYDNRKITISEADQRLRQLQTRNDIFVSLKNLDLNQQKIFLEKQVSLGKLSLEEQRTIQAKLDSQSIIESRKITDAGNKVSNNFIAPKAIAGINATNSGANVNNQTAVGKSIDNQTRDKRNKADIALSESSLETQADNRVINRFNTKQTAIQNQITSRIQQGRYNNENERQLYSLINEKYKILGTKESIDAQIRANQKKDDKGIFSFVSDLGESIFGVSDKEEARRKAKRIELDYLMNRRELFKDF